MMKTTLVMLAATLTTAAAPPIVPLQPSGKWTVEYNEDMCVLQREFGTGANAVIFGMRPVPLGQQVELVLLTRDTDGKKYRSDKGVVTLRPSGKAMPGNYRSYRLPEKPTRITRIWLEANDPATLVGSTGVIVHAGQDARADLEVGDMKRAFAALAICQDDLLKDWGIDPAVAKAVAVRPQGSLADFIDPDDYPAKARRAGESGAVTAAYLVGLDGRGRECRVVVSSKSEVLDETTCRIIEDRVRYTPALDKDRKPIATPAVARVSWEMLE